MQPVIGITPSYRREHHRYQVEAGYVEAVEAVGGVAVILPYYGDESGWERILALCDGFILSGGGDVDPMLFGEEPLPGLGPVCPRRDGAELFLTRQALVGQMPLLGICRGAQVLNVAAGGSLIQDIASEVSQCLQHSQQAPGHHASHTVQTEPGSWVAHWAQGLSLRVNSFHHQGIRVVAPSFRATARAADGVIEAIEGPGFAVGLQWHPERMWRTDESALALFESLVQAAGGKRIGKNRMS